MFGELDFFGEGTGLGSFAGPVSKVAVVVVFGVVFVDVHEVVHVLVWRRGLEKKNKMLMVEKHYPILFFPFSNPTPLKQSSPHP